MSGGISALKGLDYQATVILDRLFDHFDRHGGKGLARPEGIDDLDLTWPAATATSGRRYEQIKKPREDRDGNRSPAPWTLQDAIEELIPNSFAQLAANASEQVWILGDEVEQELHALIDGGERAPTNAAASYWRVVHALARKETLHAMRKDAATREKLLRWRVPRDLPSEPKESLARIADGFCALIANTSLDDVCRGYRQRLSTLHDSMPSVLARIRIHSLYGTEDEVARRVRDRLTTRYALQPTIIENTLFRNLRGFINDISKQPNRHFDLEEFEYELRSVWPHMLSVKDPPPIDAGHISRPALTAPFTVDWKGTAAEAVGISGSGKTTLAAEVIRRFAQGEPTRLSLYVEVRPGDRLRDALTGVAFHLRRLGLAEPFAIAVEGTATDQDVLARLSRSLAAAPRDLMLLLDLVEGTCSEAFARDLATFIQGLSSSACRIIVLGQESAFRGLNAVEQSTYGVSRHDIPGFRFEEFVKLVSQTKRDPDRAQLWNVFQRVTAGRSVGLFAGLAHALARAPSLDAMAAIAARPSEDMLPYAEQQRFARVSNSARTAAEKIICFALPFRRKDAAEIFPDDNAGVAIREMLALGLLRANDEETLEMHETVRAGLEGMLAPEVRRAAHNALASWYQRQGLVTAEILHLQKSGRAQQAQDCARDAFLRGENWGSLAPLIIEKKLVSSADVLKRLTDTQPFESIYLIANILRGLAEPIDVNALIQALRQQRDRFYSDYQWASSIIETVLAFDAGRLHELIAFVLTTMDDPRRQESSLGTILLQMRRVGVVIDQTVVAFFVSAPPDKKKLLLPFMTFESRRETLREAFAFIVSPEKPIDDRRESAWFGATLKIENQEDVVEILAALPDIAVHEILASKSPLLGDLAPLIWKQRTDLRRHCVAILGDATMAAKVLEGAIRILVFLTEPSLCALCDGLIARSSDPKVRGFAELVPSLVPALVDKARYEARFLDTKARFPTRVAALTVLAAIGADIGDLYARMTAIEGTPERKELWDFFFLQLCGQTPFEDAIPLLDKHLLSEESSKAGVFLSALTKLGALPVSSASSMLKSALGHANPRVRQVAAMALGERRSRLALAPLARRYRHEADETLAVGLATSIVASAPTSMAALASSPVDTPAMQLWKCILAKRLRDLHFAERIVTLANDRTLNWQLRRAAIAAAGRLPYAAALERIVPVVMAERTTLAIDNHKSLACHANLSPLLLKEARGLLQIFVQGKARFVEFWGEIFQSFWNEVMFSDGLPTGEDAATWLFERLHHHGWSADDGAPDNVLNELHVPLLHSSILRALRLAGRPDLIEAQLANADYVWLAAKCLLELSRVKPRDGQLRTRLEDLVDKFPLKDNEFLHRLVADLNGTLLTQPAPPAATPAGAKEPEQTPPAVNVLAYDDAVGILSGDVLALSPDRAQATVLSTVTQWQFEHLVRLADPENDRFRSIETYVPMVSFTRDGHSVAQRQSRSTGDMEPSGAWIRPALAAANRFDINIPWHEELMSGVFASSYVPRFLASLDAQDDSERFYAELFRHPDILLQHIWTAAQTRFERYLDTRMVPLLSMYVSSGTDEFFESLCALARGIDAPEIDPILQSLLHRWTQRFDVHSPYVQQSQNHLLWRGFHLLKSHPRFTMIEGWQAQLAPILHSQLAWYNVQEIARVLERDPRSYVLIESLLFKAEDWEHFRVDEIARLDDAADRLFLETTSQGLSACVDF